MCSQLPYLVYKPQLLQASANIAKGIGGQAVIIIAILSDLFILSITFTFFNGCAKVTKIVTLYFLCYKIHIKS